MVIRRSETAEGMVHLKGKTDEIPIFVDSDGKKPNGTILAAPQSEITICEIRWKFVRFVV